jgi:hypothetical protein
MSTLKYLSCLLAMGAVVATIQAASAVQNNGPAARPGPASGGAGCKNARLCALVGHAAAPSDPTIIRGKSVAAVSHPSTGVYCITPVAGLLNVQKIVPTVTVDWLDSSGGDLLAFYSPALGGLGGCPLTAIVVLTYDLQQNRSDRVAFAVVVD